MRVSATSTAQATTTTETQTATARVRPDAPVVVRRASTDTMPAASADVVVCPEGRSSCRRSSPSRPPAAGRALSRRRSSTRTSWPGARVPATTEGGPARGRPRAPGGPSARSGRRSAATATSRYAVSPAEFVNARAAAVTAPRRCWTNQRCSGASGPIGCRCPSSSTATSRAKPSAQQMAPTRSGRRARPRSCTPSMLPVPRCCRRPGKPRLTRRVMVLTWPEQQRPVSPPARPATWSD